MAASGLSAEAYVEIQNLYAYYNLMSDAGDAEGYAGCFTAEGSVEIPALGMAVRGHDDLRAFKEKDAAGRGGRYRRHWNGSLHLEKQPDGSVRGRCYLHGYNGEPGELPRLADVGVYEDTIVRVDGAWKFARRVIFMDATSFKPPAANA